MFFSTSPKIICITKGKAWNTRRLILPFFQKILEISSSFIPSPDFLRSCATAQLTLTIVFAHDPFIQKLNKNWRKKNVPTNVLSFPSYDHRNPAPSYFNRVTYPISLGDIIFGYETCLKEACEKKILFEHHMAHLFLHGFLHILGYDHMTEKEATQMEYLEVSLLKQMQISNPYA